MIMEGGASSPLSVDTQVLTNGTADEVAVAKPPQSSPNDVRESTDDALLQLVVVQSSSKAPQEDSDDNDDTANEVTEIGSVDSRLPRGQFVSREHVERLMREQDAALLESLHSGGANNAQSTALVAASPSTARTVHRLASMSVHSEDVEIESAISITEASPHPRKKRVSRVQLLTDDAKNSGLLLEAEALPSEIESVRRALSGEIWIEKAYDETVNDDQDAQDLMECNSVSAIGAEDAEELGDQEEEDSPMKRSVSVDRRLNEAAQFAEAVGDIPPAAQDELRIIEEEADDDDDDDDATEIHVEPRGSSSLRAMNSRRSKTGSDTDQTGNELRKSRPQWPFGGRGAKRLFLDKLPAQNSCQDYVYKGIKNNPPEIVMSGMARGNYSQLHRKAWLEVSDKYHRYGKNLRLYYRYWEKLGCPTNMFFDWLDSKGEAAGQPLPELPDCPRAILDSDTVLYITNPEVTNGYPIKFIPDDMGRGRAYDVDGDPVKTGSDGWIFVLRDNVLYGAKKITSISGQSKQRFHHSSFFGGKAVAAAGIFITDEEGVLTRVYPHSGHYRPGEADIQRVLFYLHHAGVDLRTFEMDMQQIMHVARDTDDAGEKSGTGGEKKKKLDSLQLVPAVSAACFLAHKARFIGSGIYAQMHQIRKADVTSVSEALALIDRREKEQQQRDEQQQQSIIHEEGPEQT